MSELHPDAPMDWNFTAETNAEGRTYIKAYKMRWDKVAKKPKRAARRHVGRLMPDDTIAMSEKFLADHPQYAGQTWYWGASRRPVTLEEYLEDFPRKPGPPADEDEFGIQSTLNIGLTWAAVETAKAHGISEHLIEVFGRDLGEALLHLAIYKLAGGTSMANYECWRVQNWLPRERRLSAQKISELLASVDKEAVFEYFKRRHQRQGEVWNRIFEKRPELKGCKIEYALDSTSISTYSKSIPEAQYGHAKRDPDLRQVNYTVVCDQHTGDIVFAYLYDGSINDSASLIDVLFSMKDAGFDLDQNILVTDRGYSSLMNVQKRLNFELSFLQGVRLGEDSINRAFERHLDSLKNGAFYDGELGVCAYSCTEDWQQNSTSGRLNVRVKLHLYRRDKVFDEQRVLIWENAQEICRLLKEGRRVPSDLWDGYRYFVRETCDANGKKTWVLDAARMDQTAEKASHFVIRTNCVEDPFQALRIYRARGLVEQDFNQLKNWVDADRLRVENRSVQGKLFVCTLACCLRMILMMTAKRSERARAGVQIPNGSIDSLLKNLELIRAQKRKNANAWVRNAIPAKRRRLLELLNLGEPPRVLRMGSR